MDMLMISNAGYDSKLAHSTWMVGIFMGVVEEPIKMIAPLYDKDKGSCAFLIDGKCELHDKGLKPTEGKLSHHTIMDENSNPEMNLTWNVAKTWLPYQQKL